MRLYDHFPQTRQESWDPLSSRHRSNRYWTVSVSVPVFERAARVKYLSHSSVLTKCELFQVSEIIHIENDMLVLSDFLESDKMVFSRFALEHHVLPSSVETFQPYHHPRMRVDLD